MLVTESEFQADPKSKSKKATAIIIAAVVHLVFLLIATLIVLIPRLRDEPEIVARVVSQVEETEIKMEQKQVVKQAEQVSSSAAASPIAKMIRAQTVARIAAPEVTEVTDGPIGLGEGDFGSGFGNGSGGGGMGGGSTMFGRSGGGGLSGFLWDLKQSPEGKATGKGNDTGSFFGVVRQLESAKFDRKIFDPFFKAKQEMTFSFLAVPTLNADEGPKAFQVEKEVKPSGWMVHYRGRVTAPKKGTYRWVGCFDDALTVWVNGKTVLDGSWDPYGGETPARNGTAGPVLGNGRPAVVGDWIDLDGPFSIDIVVGERPGGHIGGGLLIEEKGASYKKRGDGSPILPVFSTVALRKEEWARLDKFPYDFAKEVPVFRVVGN